MFNRIAAASIAALMLIGTPSLAVAADSTAQTNVSIAVAQIEAQKGDIFDIVFNAENVDIFYKDAATPEDVNTVGDVAIANGLNPRATHGAYTAPAPQPTAARAQTGGFSLLSSGLLSS